MDWSDGRIDSDGTAIAVRDYGGVGPVVLLLHGGPGQNLAFWDDFTPYLTRHLRVIAYDQRGHGESDDMFDFSYATLARDMRAVAAAFDVERPILVGHSWGGQVAICCAALDGDCAGVVAIDGYVTDMWTEIDDATWEWMEHELASDPLANFAGTAEELDDAIARDAADTRPGAYSTSALRREFAVGADGLMRYRRPAPQKIAMQRAFDVPLSPDLYDQISCPVQLIGAQRGGEERHERLSPWPFGRNAVARLQARYQRLNVAWLPCGHMVPDEMPDELAALIIGFVESTKASR